MCPDVDHDGTSGNADGVQVATCSFTQGLCECKSVSTVSNCESIIGEWPTLAFSSPSWTGSRASLDAAFTLRHRIHVSRTHELSDRVKHRIDTSLKTYTMERRHPRAVTGKSMRCLKVSKIDVKVSS